MLAYMKQLKESSDTKLSAIKPDKKEFIPLETQIQQLMATLPETMRRRNWAMDDLIARLSGKFREKPHAMRVAEALRKLGWTRHRDYSRTGDGRRIWRHP